MTRSLKERHEARSIGLVLERAKRADASLLREERASRLIVEAMSEDDLKKVTAIVQKLSSIKSPELPRLTAAIEQAEAEINRYTAGGPISAAWTKMKGLVGIDNPIVKVSTFADALEKGFAQIPAILKNNGIDLKNADLSKSLTTVLGEKLSTTKAQGTGAKTDNEMAKSPVTGKQVSDNGYSIPGPAEGVQNEAEGASPNVESKLKAIVAQLQKALSPGGIFGAFKKVPYISSAELAQELVGAPLQTFSNVAKRINSGAKAAEIAPDLKSQIVGAGGAETKGTGTSAPEKQPSQAKPAAPVKPAVAPVGGTATGEETPQPQGGGAPQNYAAAQQKVVTLLSTLKGNPKAIGDVVKKLVDAGLDATKL